MKRVSDCYLYGILDLGYVQGVDLQSRARLLCEGGVDILQFRAKGYSAGEVETMAAGILPISQEFGIAFIINDHPRLAASVKAQGAHVGQEDLSIYQARLEAASPGAQPAPIIGKSTHTVTQAAAAAAEGADYIGFGPIFQTDTKPGRLAIGLEDVREAQAVARLPMFCIGGIKLENLDVVLSAGVERVAIVSGILQSHDIPGYCRSVKERLLANQVARSSAG